MVRLRRRGFWISSRDAAGVLCPASLSPLLLLLSLAFSRTAGLGSPAARAALENVSVMQQAVQHRGDSGAVAQQFSPVI
jgi:acid phosphatase family membrane protein YuiD